MKYLTLNHLGWQTFLHSFHLKYTSRLCNGMFRYCVMQCETLLTTFHERPNCGLAHYCWNQRRVHTLQMGPGNLLPVSSCVCSSCKPFYFEALYSLVPWQTQYSNCFTAEQSVPYWRLSPGSFTRLRRQRRTNFWFHNKKLPYDSFEAYLI